MFVEDFPGSAILRRESRGKLFGWCSLEVRALSARCSHTSSILFSFLIQPSSISIKAFFSKTFHGVLLTGLARPADIADCHVDPHTPSPRLCNVPEPSWCQSELLAAAGPRRDPGPRVAKGQRGPLQGQQQALNQALTARCILSGRCFSMWLALIKPLLEI